MAGFRGRARILLVEDDPVDREMARRALAPARGRRVELRTVDTGDEALDYLQRRGAYRDAGCAPRPDLILLDLNLPGTPGLDVLRRIRETPELQTIPVVVLTSSGRAEDVQGCYASGCNSYVVKPLEPREFLAVFGEIVSHWLGRAALPGV